MNAHENYIFYEVENISVEQKQKKINPNYSSKMSNHPFGGN